MNLDVNVKVSKRYKRVTLQRVLLSKLLYDIDKFTGQDFVALLDNQLFLEKLASQDPSFKQKFGLALEAISNYLKAARFQKVADIPRVAEKFKKFIKVKLDKFVFPKRNYPEQHKLYKRFVEFRWRVPEGVLVSQLPPVQYIGKGYTDKGNAKKPHLDSSPSWQDVASRRKHSEA